MKKAFLLIVVPALLAALAFAQTPAASTNTDQTNIKGCLGGSDGNYTVVEDNTGQIFKISTSSVDLKPHLGHDVTLIGQRAGDASSAAAANSFAVTELNMISEHCAAAAAAPAATVTPPAETAVPPTAAAAAPAATTSTPAETAVAPAAVATEPAATVTPPAEPPSPLLPSPLYPRPLSPRLRSLPSCLLSPLLSPLPPSPHLRKPPSHRLQPTLAQRDRQHAGDWQQQLLPPPLHPPPLPPLPPRLAARPLQPPLHLSRPTTRPRNLSAHLRQPPLPPTASGLVLMALDCVCRAGGRSLAQCSLFSAGGEKRKCWSGRAPQIFLSPVMRNPTKARVTRQSYAKLPSPNAE